MAKTHDPIPQRTPMVDKDGKITPEWHRFLYKIFGDLETRLQAEETTSEDHETRITALEP